MKVYRVTLDVNKYQYLLPSDPKVWQTDSLVFDCGPKKDDWAVPDLYVRNPKHTRGNFLNFLSSGSLVVDRTAHNALQDLLEMSGELLPFRLGSDELWASNVTSCVDALDEAKTNWSVQSGVRIKIEKYAFHENRLPETPLFKIPETSKGEILTTVGMKDYADEFKPRVESHGLQGLLFHEVWDSQS